MEDAVGTSDGGRVSPIPETCNEWLGQLAFTFPGFEIQTYNGRAGKPFRTSPVPFLPKAGRELMLKEPLSTLVELRKISGSAVVSTRVGLPTALSNWRSFVFSRFHMALS